jgi:serine/threonine protein kinase
MDLIAVQIMMDYCGAGSLHDMMKHTQSTFAEKEIQYIIRGALKGLEYLHNMGIIHRDIKVANYLYISRSFICLRCRMRAVLTRSHSRAISS